MITARHFEELLWRRSQIVKPLRMLEGNHRVAVTVGNKQGHFDIANEIRVRN